ncbi:MAG: hypothetical protein ACI9KE_002681 [Polyangiales bacterium]|jgi:hypothetical protein
MKRLLPVLFVFFLVSCGDDDVGDAGGLDAAVGGDAGRGDDAGGDDVGLGFDAGTMDAGVDSAVGADAGAAARRIGPRDVTPTALADGTLFAAPAGDGDTCSEASPCDLWTAVDRASAGDVVFLRGGTYAVDRNLSFRGRGTDSAPAIFESYPGETAILEGSGDADDEYYVRVLGDPIVLRLFEVRGMPRSGISVRTSDNVLEGLRVYDNLLSGIHVHESYDVPVSNNNLITDCEVYGNSGAGLDTPEFADGGNSDGISMSSGIGNRVENCLVYGNSDDGIDTWRTTESYVGYSIVYGSGIASGNGQGIKAGGAPPSATSFVEHCLSYDNRGAGFDYNSGDAVVFRHNTAWDNDGSGFYAGNNTSVVNNLAGGDSAPFGGPATPENNSWQREGEVMFISTDPTSSDFLRPALGSGFEDLGAHAGRE